MSDGQDHPRLQRPVPLHRQFGALDPRGEHSEQG